MEEATARYQAATDEPTARWLLARGLGKEVAHTARVGVATKPIHGHERYQGRLAIPYIVAGHPVTIRFRCLRDHDCKEASCAKYLTLPDEPSRMFNVGAVIRASTEIDVTEGEFDALILEQLGYPAVAIPGAHSWASHHRRMLAGFSRIRVWGDGDEAGREFGQKVTRVLRQAKAVRVPKGHDVTSIYLAEGEGAVRELIERTYG